MKTTKSTAHWDGMCWPRAGDAAGELQWRLRYAPQSVTREDQLHAAQIIEAYQTLVLGRTQKRRNEIAKKLAEAELP